MTAALDGKLDQKMLARLSPAAATMHVQNEYRAELARVSEHVFVGAIHRALEAGGADAIIMSLRPGYDRHAKAIAKAKSLFTSESSPEHILASGEPELVTSWQQLGDHIRAVTAIASVVSEFGPRPQANFPLVREYSAGETFKLDNRAVMATTGGLVSDSAEFVRPSDFHKNSAFFRCGGLRLHTIAEAQARHDEWAAGEHDRMHSGPRGGRLIDGEIIPDPVPPNPFRREAANA